MTTYGLNNNTGTTLSNSTNNFDKINKKVNNAGEQSRMINQQMKAANEIMNSLKGWQNAKTGGDKIKSLAGAIGQFMK